MSVLRGNKNIDNHMLNLRHDIIDTAFTMGNVLRSTQQKGVTIMKKYSIRHCLTPQVKIEGNHLTTLYSAIHSTGIYSILYVLLKKGKLNNS